jgi:hypothetical protein
LPRKEALQKSVTDRKLRSLVILVVWKNVTDLRPKSNGRYMKKNIFVKNEKNEKKLRMGLYPQKAVIL